MHKGTQRPLTDHAIKVVVRVRTSKIGQRPDVTS
jgi:hypothetical protein